ncbi:MULTISPECIES: TOMM precursor leader peptide-binding protein [unclassified Streptomyces]|uniref:TOMM precursor leader peptide-binding protein n=1 Tax=unclassified Streptomyces TaxID=2593676 RepID=UPI0033A7C4A8
MATAIRLTQAPLEVDPSSAVFAGTGPFGRSVARLLARTTGGRDLTADLPPDGDPCAAFDSAPSAVVLALWRPAPALCERVDERSHATGIPWLSVVLEPSTLQVGPLVVPGAGPCHRCLEERRTQHDRHWPETAALHAAYDRDPRCGPRGHLPQHVTTAAGLAATVLSRPRDHVGQVLTARLRGVSVRRDRLLACHGCARCGQPLPDRDLRVLLRLNTKEDAGVQ